MTITPLELIQLKAGLSALDSFKFDSKTTYTLSRNLNWVESELKPIESTRKKLAEEHGNPKQEDDNFKVYLEKWEEFLNSPIEIKDLRKISYSDFKVGNEENENSIPIRVINLLFPIILEEQEPAKGKKSK